MATATDYPGLLGERLPTSPCFSTSTLISRAASIQEISCLQEIVQQAVMSDYKIRPSFKEKFPASAVREIIRKILKDELSGQQYADDA